MYTQAILLLVTLHSLNAYSVVQIELKNGTEVSGVKELSNQSVAFLADESKLPTLREIIFVVDKFLEGAETVKESAKKKETPEEPPLIVDGSLRPFTNGHGYQFADWELVYKHQPKADNSDDNTDNDSNIDSGDEDDDDDTDKNDDSREVTKIPVIDPRQSKIDTAKNLRNRIFDEMKEKYHAIKRNKVVPSEKVRSKRQINYQNTPGAPPQHGSDPTASPDYMNRMLVQRPVREPYDYTKKAMNPIVRDENGNILYDNKNTAYASGRQYGNIPRGYVVNNDPGYSLNYINNMQNQPTYKHQNSQPAQQRPMESYSANNPHKQTTQSNITDAELTNIQMTTQEINGNNYIHKLTQSPNYETINNKTQEIEYLNKNGAIDKERAMYNGEVNTTMKHNKEMLRNVNQMSKKINNIKEKFKDRFTNVNAILNTTEGRKILAQGMSMVADKEETTNDIGTSHTPVNYFISQDSNNHTTDNNIEFTKNKTFTLNYVEEVNIRDNNSTDKETEADSSLIEVTEKNDIKIDEDILNISENTVNLNDTLKSNKENQNNNQSITNQKTIPYDRNVELLPSEMQNNNLSITNQTNVENKCENSELDEIVNNTCNETKVIGKHIDEDIIYSTIDPVNIDCFNETTTDIEDETCTELFEETETEAFLTNENRKEDFNSEEKFNADDNDQKSEHLILDDLFQTNEFWNWLSKWTTAYMEILNENIEIIVKQEVAKQLEEILMKTEIEKASESEKNRDQEKIKT